MFGDAGFALSRYLQTIEKGSLTRRGRTFNSVMSRIRIYVENMFAGQSTIFNFLSFGTKLRLGGRNIDRLYVTANFLMNVRACFYGNHRRHRACVDRARCACQSLISALRAAPS